MMPDSHHPPALPDAGARQRALLDYGATLLVEAGAGSGKTALMAGRVALMLAHGIQPRDIVAITFTEAAAAELSDASNASSPPHRRTVPRNYACSPSGLGGSARLLRRSGGH
jgi:superfamily I DNA/RNA helicase